MDCMRMNTEYLGYSAGSPVIHAFGRLYKVLARRISTTLTVCYWHLKGTFRRVQCVTRNFGLTEVPDSQVIWQRRSLTFCSYMVFSEDCLQTGVLTLL
ncbi:hypothetical protein ACET3Z_027732 [Daucus carota]